MDTDCVIVLTTIGVNADWRMLASTLVNERLAACVNVLAEMDSVYRWQGQVDTDRERQVVIKTTSARVAALEARVRELHAYELPEFIVVPIAGGGASYLAWIRESAAR
jgi:periplasmic divalent cation tolerance protein